MFILSYNIKKKVFLKIELTCKEMYGIQNHAAAVKPNKTRKNTSQI